MSKKQRRKAKWAVPLAILSVAVIAFIVVKWITAPSPRTLQDALATKFNSPVHAIVANVPSRAARYPGAVLAISKGSELIVRRAERPAQLPHSSGSLKGVEFHNKEAAWALAGKTFSAEAEGVGTIVLELDLEDLRVFEIEAGTLAADLREDENVRTARSSGHNLSVVTRSFEAVPTITIRATSQTQATTWAKLRENMIKAKGESQDGSSVVFRSALPQVIAYEVQDVQFIASTFAPDKPEVRLQPRPASPISLAVSSPLDFKGQVTGSFAFSSIASPSYRHGQFGDLPAASVSASLVESVLSAAGGTKADMGLDPQAALSTAQFQSALAGLIEKVKISRPPAFVLYFCGHGVSGPSGSHYLVMGDYRGDLKKDIPATSPFLPPAGPGAPISGSNLDDIAKVIAAAGQELAPSAPGLISVADVHKKLSEVGVPFAIVIDGCYPADAIADLQKHLKFTPWGDYYGAANVPLDEHKTYFDAIKTYGTAPYLRSTNPVIFAAKPGTLARMTPHPLFDTDLIVGVGPLGAKLARRYHAALANAESLTLGAWLRFLADFAGTGELQVTGSISWSDFDNLRSIELFKFE